MGEWGLLPCEDPRVRALGEALKESGAVQRFTQLPEFARLSAEELSWNLWFLARSDPPGLLPLAMGPRRCGRARLAESLPLGVVAGPLGPRAWPKAGIRAKALAWEVLLYPGRVLEPARGWREVPWTTHEAVLDPDDPLHTPPSPSCRGAARHAQGVGVEVAAVCDEATLGAIWGLHRRQQEARGVRVYPMGWVRRLLAEMPDASAMWAAWYQGRPVAALLVGWWRGHATALLSVGDPEARPLKAGNLLYLAVWEELARRGVRVVDLGGSRGIRSLEWFKESLGARRTPRCYYRWRHPLVVLVARLARRT